MLRARSAMQEKKIVISPVPHGIGLPFSLWRRCLPSGFHQSPLLSSFYLPCGICPAPACGAYLRVFTNALFLIAIKKVSVDGFPAWFSHVFVVLLDEPHQLLIMAITSVTPMFS